MSSARDRVIKRINEQIGDGTDRFSQSKVLIQHYTTVFLKINSKLTINNSCEKDSPIKSIISACESTINSVHSNSENVEAFTKNVSQLLFEYDEVLDDVADPLAKVNQLQQITEYLNVIQDINQVSTKIQKYLDINDDAKAVGTYLKLCSDDKASGCIIGQLAHVDAAHLRRFVESTALHWYNILVTRFSKEFEITLKAIKWPNLGSAADVFSPSKEACSKLVLLAEYLFLIHSPINIATKNEYIEIANSILCKPINKVIQLLLKTFRQRFLYHFSGLKQTNRLDKPEWFYTQILSWAKDNHEFVGKTFQIAAHHSGCQDLNVRVEFIRGLVHLAIEKLSNDMEELAQDDHLFAHVLDETLSFEQELRETLAYPSSTMESAVTLLAQPQYLTKWLAAEMNFSTSHMDDMLKRGNPWEFIDPINLEDVKIPKCADQFVRLLDAIKERYCTLPQPGHRLQFLELQIELIDSFRRRLIQLHNSIDDTNVTSTVVLNSINYIVSVMREWGENMHYLHLHMAQVGSNSEEVSSVFDKSIKELEHWSALLIKDLSSKILDDIKSKSMLYRRNTWISMAEIGSKDVFALSPSASEMFQLIVTVLHTLETELSKNLFQYVLRLVASRLDAFIVDGLIMNTKFSCGGADQFHFDMTRNLFPLFGQYSNRPALLFKQINDACILLKLQKGTALLLHHTLKQSPNKSQTSEELRDIGVKIFSVQRSQEILERRNDVTAI